MMKERMENVMDTVTMERTSSNGKKTKVVFERVNATYGDTTKRDVVCAYKCRYNNGEEYVSVHCSDQFFLLSKKTQEFVRMRELGFALHGYIEPRTGFVAFDKYSKYLSGKTKYEKEMDEWVLYHTAWGDTNIKSVKDIIEIFDELEDTGIFNFELLMLRRVYMTQLLEAKIHGKGKVVK